MILEKPSAHLTPNMSSRLHTKPGIHHSHNPQKSKFELQFWRVW